jgi:hypothetical protein
MVLMPSWNIHIAHVERLLARDGAEALGVRDPNAFLFGNLVPDIYVGYLVSPITKKIPYRTTHFADPAYVPQPAYWEFWERYARPLADAAGRVSDVVLGAWMHLLADNVYNAHNNRYIAERGIAPGEETRKRKQADFALFGRTLDISTQLHADDALLAQAAAFPQYAIAEPDARATVAVANDVVRDNRREHVTGTPDYCMLSAEFFSSTFERVCYLMERNLKAYARHGALGCGDFGSDGNA